MIFVKTFKGLEDKPTQIDAAANEWIQKHRVDVRDVKVVLAHEPGSRSGSGDFLFVVMYNADAPIA